MFLRHFLRKIPEWCCRKDWVSNDDKQFGRYRFSRPPAIEIIRSGWALKCAPCCPFNAHLYLRRDFLCSFYGIGGVRERCSRMSAVSVGKLPQFLYYPGMKGIFLGKVRGGWFKGFYGRVLLDIASDRLRFEVCGNELKRMLHGFCLKSALYIRKDFRYFSLGI